ncbi:MAG: DUF2231 domain-containing protein [Gammaproteobacteria bacterium]
MIDIIPNWHPVFVHFTVALLTVAGLLFLVVVLIPAGSALRAQLLSAANWNLWLGLVISLGTATAGWVASTTVAHDEPSHVAMTVHRNFAIATVTIYIPIVVWSVIRARKSQVPGWRFALVVVVATGLVLATAYRGGELVYRYGLGVMALPQVHEHAHVRVFDDHGEAAHAHAHGPAETVSHDAGQAQSP